MTTQSAGSSHVGSLLTPLAGVTRSASVVPSINAVAAFPFPRDTIKGWIQEKVWNLTNQWITCINSRPQTVPMPAAL
jgi:hypothetical protein